MSRLNKETLAAIKTVIENNSRFVIVSHTNPDGDALGSSLAWFNVLSNMGKNVNNILPNDCPDFLKWINGADKITLFNKQKKEAIDLLANAEVIIFVDFNRLDRIEEVKQYISKNNNIKILIDHHPQPEAFADYTVSVPEASSASELVHEVMMSIGLDKFIDKNAAEAIYIGIITDTGSLSHNSSNPITYNTIAHLLTKKIDKTKIHENTFNVHSADRMRLLGKLLNENMCILHEYNTAYMFISKEDQKKYNFTTGDSEGFVNYPLAIKGIKFAALFTENDDLTKISLRSKDEIPANQFSETHFNGGGHRNAAGGRIKKSMQEAIQIFESGLPDFKKYLC